MCARCQVSGGHRQTRLTNHVSDSDVLAEILIRRSQCAYNYSPVIIENYYFQPLQLDVTNYLLVWAHRDHLYVIGVYNGIVAVADGVNDIKSNTKAKALSGIFPPA